MQIVDTMMQHFYMTSKQERNISTKTPEPIRLDLLSVHVILYGVMLK